MITLSKDSTASGVSVLTQGVEINRCANLDSWLVERKKGIGSSDAPAVMGESQWKGRWQLWAEKRGEIGGQETNDAMRWGHYLEDDAAEDYTRQTSRELLHLGDYTVLRSIRLPFMSCTHDRLIAPIDSRGVGVLSIKTTSAYKEDDWNGQVPLDYQIQLQHELSVSGCTWGSFAVVIGGQRLRWVDVERNNAFIASLEEEEREFWRMVQEGDEPPPDADDKWALKKRWPTVLGGAPPVILPPESDEWDAEYQRLMSQKADINHSLKAVDDKLSAIEVKFRAAIKDASSAICANGARYSLNVTNRPAVEATSFRSLRRLKEKR